jgi:integrase
MKLTKRTLEGLAPAEKRYVVWDDELPRFGVRVEVSGTRTFVVDYDAPDGRRRRLTLGRFGVLAIDQARDLAKQAMSAAAVGSDPLQKKQEARAELTLGDFAAIYLEYAKAHKKPHSVRADTDALERLVPRSLRSRKLSTVSREDIARLHRSQAAHPAQANRMLATLSHLFTLASEWGYLPGGENPCRRVPRFRENRRTRFLSADELGRLGASLNALEQDDPYQVRAIRLLLLTGCRLNEILTLRWDDVDLAQGVLHLRDAKAGPRDVPLGGPAIALLQAAEQERGQSIEAAKTTRTQRTRVADDARPWVIPSRSRPGRHLVNLEMFWSQSVVPAAGLSGVRLHDLRHTVGSVGAGAGLSILMVGNVLGHRQTSTAERYAHVGQGPLHDAADRISNEIAAALERKPLAEVTELRKA